MMHVPVSRWLLVLLAVAAVVLIKAGQDDSAPQAQNTVAQQGVAHAAKDPTATAVTPEATASVAPSTQGGGTVPVRLTTEQLQQYKPNELGEIPILEYHQIDSPPAQFVRTPDQLRGDLQWLYDHGFYVVSLNDILNDDMRVPAGKKPVALTFDDSAAGQFRLLRVNDNQYAIDPNCAVGILEKFYSEHPDFGRGGHFAVLPTTLFDWTLTKTEQDQVGLGQMKLRWLLDNGYEIGNHTLDHANLAEITDAQVKYQLAAANDEIHKLVPDANVDVITLPFGTYPDHGDDTLFRGLDYNGKHYAWRAALLVGANPTVSPISTQFDPYSIPRIQAFDEELDKWFTTFENNPGMLYVSDGNPNTVTVPNELHDWIAGTLDLSKIGNRELIRY